MSEFDSKIEITRNLADQLVPYNFPVAPVELEYYISALKKSETNVDGYSIVYHFNRALYKDYYLETFQIYNKYAPFLPFYIVAKLAKKVLGSHFLSLVEFYQDDHKIYCWSVCLDKKGRPIISPAKEKCKSENFEGFEYLHMSPDQFNFY